MSEQVDAIWNRIRDLDNPGRGFSKEDFENESMRNRARKDSDKFWKLTEAFKTLADHVNGGETSILEAAFVDEMCRTHRHLQGVLLVSLLNALGNYGLLYKEDTAAYADARNEFAMGLLKKFRERFKDELFWRDK